MREYKIFHSPDPLAFETPHISPYSYCNGDPINYIDPTGEKPLPSEAARMAAHVYGDKTDDILIGGWSKTPDNLGLKSLGGGQAALNALVTGNAAITFNPAGVSGITKFKDGSWLTPFMSESRIDAYIMTTDPQNILQDRLPIPGANGNRHYLLPKDIPSIYNGHSMDNILKCFGVNPDDYAKVKL